MCIADDAILEQIIPYHPQSGRRIACSCSPSKVSGYCTAGEEGRTAANGAQPEPCLQKLQILQIFSGTPMHTRVIMRQGGAAPVTCFFSQVTLTQRVHPVTWQVICSPLHDGQMPRWHAPSAICSTEIVMSEAGILSCYQIFDHLQHFGGPLGSPSIVPACCAAVTIGMHSNLKHPLGTACS